MWVCTVTPNDGTEDGVISTDSMTIASKFGLTDCDANLDFGGELSVGECTIVDCSGWVSWLPMSIDPVLRDSHE